MILSQIQAPSLVQIHSAEGKMKSILITDQIPVKNVAGADVWERYKEVITDLSRNGHYDLQIGFFLAGDYRVGMKKIAIVKEGLEELFKDQNREYGFDPDRQIIALSPVIDFALNRNEEIDLPEGLYGRDDAEIFSPTEWVQDCCLILRNDCDQTVMLVPQYAWLAFESDNEEEIPVVSLMAIVNKELPRQISLQTDILLKPTRFLFEGGNVLSLGDKLIVGSDLIRTNFRLYSKAYKNYSTLAKAMARDFGVDHILCPGLCNAPDHYSDVKAQPKRLKHLDMFLTVLGTNSQGHELVLLGQVMEYDQANQGWVKSNCSENLYLDDLNTWFRTSKNYLHHNANPFRVVRIPILDYQGMLLSYNNCLPERVGGRITVFLPSYGFKQESDLALRDGDQKVQRMLKEEKEIDFIMLRSDFLPLSMAGGGSLRCMIKVLERTM